MKIENLARLLLRRKEIFLYLSAPLIVISIYLALIYAPEADYFSSVDAQRIFYFHVPAAWVSYLAFFIVFAASILYLKTGKPGWDMAALSAAEIGVVFCTVAVVSGSLWGKAEWDKYWNTNDVKLTITFVLWLVYLAYVVLRLNSSGESEARLAASFGIMGFVAVPLSFVASRVAQSLHPNVVASREGSITGEMVFTLVFAVITFTVFFIYLFLLRFELERNRRRLEAIKAKMEASL